MTIIVIPFKIAGTWNPAWSVSTILTGLLSFMLEETATTGSIETGLHEKKILAQKSLVWNRQQKLFREVFPELAEMMPEPPKLVKKSKPVAVATPIPFTRYIRWFFTGIVFYLVALKLWARLTQ